MKHRRSRAKFPAEEIIAQGPLGDIIAVDFPYRSLSPNIGGPSEPEESFIPLVLDDDLVGPSYSS